LGPVQGAKAIGFREGLLKPDDLEVLDEAIGRAVAY
jgi:hypothetical protein